MNVYMTMDYDDIKANVICKLINKAKNEDILKVVPNVDFLDMASIFYIYNSETGEAILISNVIAQIFNVTSKELMKAAKTNTTKLLGVKVRGLLDTINFYLTGEEITSKESDLPIYVVTNENAHNGAGCLVDNKVLKTMSEKFDCNWYIIPCSVHELLFVKDIEGIDIQAMRELIPYVNETELRDEDILSDSLYYYNKATKKLSIA